MREMAVDKSEMPIHINGTWQMDDPRRAFVDGAKWMLWQLKGCTMFAAEVDIAEREANRRYLMFGDLQSREDQKSIAGTETKDP